MNKHLYILAMFAMMLLGGSATAQVVTVSVNSWHEEIDENDLSVPLEAGYDLDPTMETSTNFNQLDVFNVAKTKTWRVTVSRRDVNWPAALSLYIKRTSIGTPCAGCTGVNVGASPSVYVQVVPLETDFIYGTGEVTGIDLQVKVEGLSLTLDADNYSTEIIYTLFGD